ncbi:MAG: hypothetical protein FD178_2256 [Ignavibacteria bacterium]|nr:MAG: hypothetical protein FD178_2256 [Ignavibacteria bacterium]
MTVLEKILLVVGGSITLCFGVWHFFVPTKYNWFSYTPSLPSELKRAIEASNFFLSTMLVLFGIVTMYFAISETSEVKIMMITMSVLWLIRTIYQIVEPQGSLIPGLTVILTVVFFATSLCFIIPLILIGVK